jgi:H+/Cl- antiporter ClcA
MSTRTLVHKGVVVVAATATLLLAFADPAHAVAAIDTSQLSTVLDNLRLALAGILAGLATIFLTIGAILYLAAGGDRRNVERGKQAMKSALIGFALAGLAPILIDIVRRVVGL